MRIAVRIETPEGVTVSETTLRGPEVEAETDIDPREFLVDVTGLEAAVTTTRAAGEREASLLPLAPASPGACPFQEGNLCGVHSVRPLGCRVYFCDRSAQAWQHELSERMQERIRRLHDEAAIPYRYAEWRWLLELVRCADATSYSAAARGSGCPSRP